MAIFLNDPKFKPKNPRAVKLTITLPPFTAPRTISTCKHRKRVSPHQFCHEVFENADVSEVFRKSTCENVTAKNKNAINSVVREALGAPRIYFNKTELSIILHMYIQMTGQEMRDISTEEMKGFLHSTLGITNPYSLDGLCRASGVMDSATGVGSKRHISPLAFVRTLSILLRGTIDDRAELAFHVVDFDGDGLLRKTVEFRRLLHNSFDVSISAQNPEIDPDEPSRDTVNYLCDKLNCTVTSHVSLPYFRAMCLEEPWIVECLLPCIPEERINIVFQSLFTTSVHIPSLEHSRQISR
ncbi:unnamed protein product [Mesocestoides corti]|uniref:EF-hand domain-containing protein n=1 Tax=Mesocestoides corti TaxID=53468 RepID=A0A0R3UIR7_MESCO|nr:unnamed protein product [Mesocestoides corti]